MRRSEGEKRREMKREERKKSKGVEKRVQV
jgi:hypothetical protein